MERNQIWDGWTVEKDMLIGPNGNRYTKKSIQASFFERQIPKVSNLLIHPGCKKCTKAN